MITWSSVFSLSSIAKSTILACPLVGWFQYGLAFVGVFGNNFCTTKTDDITRGHLANKQLFDKALKEVLAEKLSLDSQRIESELNNLISLCPDHQSLGKHDTTVTPKYVLSSVHC